MTVEAFTPAPPQVIAGLGPYPVAHPYQTAGELIVQVVQGATLATLAASAYAVEPAQAPTGTGAITLGAAAAAAYAGWSLLVTRATRAEQGWSGMSAREKGMERQLDRIVHVLQDHGIRIADFERLPADVAAAIAAADRAEAAAALVDPVWQFASLAGPNGLRSHDFNGAPPDAVRVLGYGAAGDGGATIMLRRSAPSTHGVYETSVGGVVWEVAPAASYDARIWGGGLGLGLNSEAFAKGVRICAAQGGELVLPQTFTSLETDISLSNLSFFHVRGMGQLIDKLAAAGGAFVSLTDCHHFTLRDFELDCRKRIAGVGAGGHGLRLNRCPDCLVLRVGVRDWTNSGIIAMDDDAVTQHYDRILVHDCSLDGYGNANNGILFACCRDSEMRGCDVHNLGRSGAPCFAQQLKSNNLRCKIVDGSVKNARAGFAAGDGDTLSTYCQIQNCTAEGCTQAIRLAFVSYCTIDTIIVDMADAADLSPAAAWERAIFLRTANNNTITNVVIRNYAYSGRQPIYVDSSVGCHIEVVWNNGGGHEGGFLQYDTTSAQNVVWLKSYAGALPTRWGDWITYGSANTNRTRILDGSHTARRVIAAGAVTLPDLGIDLLEVDTEAAAATDDLVTITGGTAGMELLLTPVADSRAIVVMATGGNLRPSGGDRTMPNRSAAARFCLRGGLDQWIEA